MKIHLTPVALEKIRHIRYIQDKSDHGLRVEPMGCGSCGESAFFVGLDAEPTATDLVATVEDVAVYVPEHSASILEGATVDYAVTAEGEGFRVDTAGDGPDRLLQSGCCGCQPNANLG